MYLSCLQRPSLGAIGSRIHRLVASSTQEARQPSSSLPPWPVSGQRAASDALTGQRWGVRDGHHEGKGRRATDAKDKKRQLHMTGQQKRNRCAIWLEPGFRTNLPSKPVSRSPSRRCLSSIHGAWDCAIWEAGDGCLSSLLPHLTFRSMAANDKMNLPAQTTLNATLADVPPRYEPSGMVVLTSVWSRRHHEARRTHGRLCSSEPQPTTRPCLQVRRHAASAPTHPIMHPYAQSRALTQACVKMHAMAGTVLCTSSRLQPPTSPRHRLAGHARTGITRSYNTAQSADQWVLER
ncbi:uncharacterized protein TRIREDRAFT_107972 [Trichoderma reesei QM6a]|uniref:Predicted protein n=2 Tax=Hypocrea jecorina TaxID=51453 RepID=G0RK52_HYPJQ|nr:uncharacterized protein TRIREDRAFT_107972 [Trichoderma reesei QM6a]EGR48311.1 predicted protein [Trichoderma reesei QM6a]ETS07198.1 hypothetical protein M419DRAFT_126627 [Trichoderma reesei RUT C-30]